MSLWWAVDQQNYPLANLLLDHGADARAYAWANASMIERLYEHAVKDGAPVEIIRKGFENYLGAAKELAALYTKSPDSVKLLQRVLSLGGQPSCHSIVEAGYFDLVEELLLKCPEEPGTRHDTPQGTVFENLCNASSWTGHPRVMEFAMVHCPHLRSPEHAKQAIIRAIVSHNRFGSVSDYFSLIETQLKFLHAKENLVAIIQSGTFLPHHKVASDYLWPDHYGYGDSKSTVESMIELTKLLTRYGFDPHLAKRKGTTGTGRSSTRKRAPRYERNIAFLIKSKA